MGQELDWEKFFGFGDSVQNKVYAIAPNSVWTLAPISQYTKLQPSTSSALTIGIITVPYTGFQGVCLFFSTSGVYIFTTSVVGSNITKGGTMQFNQPIQMFCDGAAWYAIGPSTSNT